MSQNIEFKDQFTHDFFFKKDGQLYQGMTGSQQEVAVKVRDIVEVPSLNSDLDIQKFHADFQPLYQKYLSEVLPELGLIQTSADGNLHSVVEFVEPVDVQTAKKYSRCLRDLLFADGDANWFIPRRLPGSINSKHNDDFEVKLVKEPTKISAEKIEDLLTSEGEASPLPRWYELSFNALFKQLRINDELYWHQGRTNGICPIHGSGNNPNQCSYHPEEAKVACFADCKEGDDVPKTFYFRQILERHVFNCDISGRYQLADAAGDRLFWQKDSVAKNQELIRRLTETDKHVRMGRQPFKITKGEMISLAGESANTIGKLWTASVDVKIYNQSGGDVKPYNFTAGEVGSILLEHITELPEVKFRLHRSALNDNREWTEVGLDGAYFTSHAIKREIPAKGACPNLNTLLDMWPWKSEADRTNAAATFLNRIFSGISKFAGKHLTTIISGNQQGVGKTELANCVLLMAQGSTNALLTEREVKKGDFERSLVPKIKNAPTSVLLVDNVVGNGSDPGIFDSTNIVPMMTDKRMSSRLFHSQDELDLVNNYQWLITTNGADFSKDLIERSNLVEIQFQGDPIRRQADESPLEFVEKHLEELHAELKGLYENWVEKGRPIQPIHGRNKEFFTLINSVLHCNGFQNFDANRQDLRATDSDPESELLVEIFSIIKDGGSFRAKDVLNHLEEGTSRIFCGFGSERSKQTRLGKTLSKLVGREIVDNDGSTYLLRCRKINNGNQFQFDPVQAEHATEGSQAAEGFWQAGREQENPKIVDESQEISQQNSQLQVEEEVTLLDLVGGDDDDIINV